MRHGAHGAAQTRRQRRERSARKPSRRPPWGHPDLQGIWDQTTGTPLERPDEYKGRKLLTDAEAADRERLRFAEFDEDGRAGGTGDYGSVWREQSKNALNRTALITDPEDGRIPPLTPAGAERPRGQNPGAARAWRSRLMARSLALGTLHHARHAEDSEQLQQQLAHPADRATCRDPAGNDSRNPDHSARWPSSRAGKRAPMARRFARPLGKRHARRRDHQLQRQRGVQGFALNNARLVERFRRLGPDRLDYEFTIDDPTVYTKPWTVSLPFILGTRYFEYACHEGNYGLPNILSGARAADKSQP